MAKDIEGGSLGKRHEALKETYALNVAAVAVKEIKAATDRAQQTQNQEAYHMIDDVAGQIEGGKPSVPLSQEQKDSIVKDVTTIQMFRP
jgi:hypothetical protein